MRSRILLLVLFLALAAGVTRASVMNAQVADGEKVCPVTKAPDPAFVPPAPFKTPSGGFLYGTPKLWALVSTDWRVHGLTENKLPYFRQGFDWKKENDPRMTVTARRLDGPDPLVWSEWVNSGGLGADHPVDAGGFMVTSLHIPGAGCWEIAAHYYPTRDNVQTLTYTVWVKP